jgi:RNA polymerase sigma-70 factor (ECF subfamily)
MTPSSALAAEARDAQADLMERVAQDRDRTAFAQLFAYFAPRVKSYLLRLGAADGLAEDIAQEVMVTVWRKAGLFDRRQASVSTWIFRIARNRRIDAFRRDAKPALDPEDPLLSPAPETPPDEAIEAQEREAAVRDALQTLPPEQVEMLQLAFFEGLSHSEIAEARGLPLGTVKSRLRLAFDKLRAKLDAAL